MTRILVIHDEQPLEGLLESLVYAGFDVVRALGKEAGLSLACTQQPDIILYDTAMPEWCGYDVLQAVRDNPATAPIPFILLTANGAYEAVRQAMGHGADDYLIRPFTHDELLTAIDARLQRQIGYQELQAHLSAAREMEQLKTDLIRIAAHDLRNPLNSMAAALSLLRRRLGVEYLEANFPELEAIEAATAQMNRITSDILSLEYIEALGQKAAYQTVDLKALVQDSYQTHLVWAQQKGQHFDLVLAQAPILVHGDRIQLREAIHNLIANAIKYTPEGGHLNMRLDKVGKMTRFIVEDNGCGIPDDQQTRLFQPFYRAQTLETTHVEGSGLGLHLVKNIIERHSGQMLVHSVYGEGSVFGFFLPLQAADPAPMLVPKHRGLITRMVNKLMTL